MDELRGGGGGGGGGGGWAWSVLISPINHFNSGIGVIMKKAP